jgi:hypothetical protein
MTINIFIIRWFHFDRVRPFFFGKRKDNGSVMILLILWLSYQ